MAIRWAVRLVERLDQRALDALRSALDLTRTGRLSDDWDELFGETRMTSPGGAIGIELWRDVDSGEWRFDVEAVPDVEVSRVVAGVRAAVESAGLRVASCARR